MDRLADQGRLGRDSSKIQRGRPSRLRADWRRRLLVSAAGLVALGVVLALFNANQALLGRLDNLVFDNYQRISPRAEAGAPVTVVDIDEASIARIGQWPWPRTTIAKLVERLGQLGAAAIAFDIVFPETDRTSPSVAVSTLEAEGAKITLPPDIELDNDAVLAKAFGAAPVIAGIAISNETDGKLPPPKASFAYGGLDPKNYLTPFRGGVADLPALSQAATGIGFFSFPPSQDGVVRDLPLVANVGGALYPALSIEALRVAQGASTFIVRSTGASGEENTGRPAMTALKVGAFALPTGPGGEFRIYYSGLKRMPTIPAADLLDNGKTRSLGNEIAGRIVIVGTSAVGLRDLAVTPLGTAVAGARVHAEVIDQIMGQTFLSRPDWAPGAEIFAAVLAGLIVLGLEVLSGAIASSLATVLLVALAALGSWWAFTDAHLLLDPILPALAAALVFALTTPVLLLWTDREKRFIRAAFGRYLSPELVGRLAENPSALQLGGEMRDLTILFADIRNFTTISESLSPEALTSLLNGFLTPATDVLLGAEATIDKYIGDAIMAFWSAPLEIADHRRKACLGALAMLEALETLGTRTGTRLTVGVGLNAGECCVGNFGSARRFNYSAIGDSVNVASRVEGLTKQYAVPILVTEAVRSGAADLAFVEIDSVRVVGRHEPLAIFALLGGADVAQSPEFAGFAQAQRDFLGAYRRLDLSAAETALAAARAAAPSRLAGLYRLYAERLQAMRVEPPPPGWDGVFVLKQK
jgi:adenylate cyclase